VRSILVDRLFFPLWKNIFRFRKNIFRSGKIFSVVDKLFFIIEKNSGGKIFFREIIFPCWKIISP
jgi:hypothetical protein